MVEKDFALERASSSQLSASGVRPRNQQAAMPRQAVGMILRLVELRMSGQRLRLM